jgi:uroporphyrinogen decarboxylase
LKTGTVTPRDRCISALKREEPDFVPLFEFGIETPIVEWVLGRRLPMTSASSSQNTRIKAEDLVHVYETLGLDMITVTDDAFISETGKPRWKDATTFVNEFGQVWKVDQAKSTEFYIGGDIQLSDDMEPPMLDPLAPGRSDFAKEVVRVAHKKDMAVTANVRGGFSAGYLGCGMENFFVGMLRYPAQVRTLILTFANFWTEVSKQLIDIGIDVIGIADDLADKNGPFVSPGVWRSLVKPGLEQLAREVKKRGGLVFFHSDGNLNPVLDDIVGIGFDGLHSMEPVAGMDIGLIKKRYGDKLCLLGNVDCSHTLCVASISEVAEETRNVIKQASPGGGHILTSSNSLHSGVRLENYLTMVVTARRLGRYPLSDLG